MRSSELLEILKGVPDDLEIHIEEHPYEGNEPMVFPSLFGAFVTPDDEHPDYDEAFLVLQVWVWSPESPEISGFRS